ncbi:MAG: MvaI/BcnI family restriction endonuclease [Candidatus Kryptonium sp.]
MTKAELIKKLQEIKDKGFVSSTRSGTTGIGHTLEKLLGLRESNIAIPDIGARIEVKATRRHANNLITLFTFNRGVWKIPQRDLIMKYGYLDIKNRKALKTTLFYGMKSNIGNLSLELDKANNVIHIVDSQGEVLGSYDLYLVIAKFVTKVGRILLCIADSRREGNQEYFWFNEFYLLSETTPHKFIQAFENGYIGIDIRMHLKPMGTVRNRGTAFRVKEGYLKNLYEKIEILF